MQHFLSIADFSSDELWEFLFKAKELKDQVRLGQDQPILRGKTLGMIFQKPSLRTRVSFEVGMLQLGGQAVYISPSEVGLGTRESVSDVARVLSGYVNGIMARVFSHDHILELARFSRVPIINGLSDYNHPCQALADVFTIWEHFGAVKGVKVAYVGDGNNMATSLATILAKLGLNISLASPKQYELPAKILADVVSIAEESGATVLATNDPQEAVAEADVVYTDVWTSMGQEEETDQRLSVFPPYQVNSQLLALARPQAVVMHCLPAHRGEEITADVVDGRQSVVFEQAENRLHAQKGILALLLTNGQG